MLPLFLKSFVVVLDTYAIIKARPRGTSASDLFEYSHVVLNPEVLKNRAYSLLPIYFSAGVSLWTLHQLDRALLILG